MNYEEIKQNLMTPQAEPAVEVVKQDPVAMLRREVKTVEQPKSNLNLAALVFGGSIGLIGGVIIVFFAMSGNEKVEPSVQNSKPVVVEKQQVVATSDSSRDENRKLAELALSEMASWQDN